MNGRTRRFTRSTLTALIAAAGLPAAVSAAPDSDAARSAASNAANQSHHTVRASVTQTTLSFHKVSALMGSPVIGADGSEMASVEDLIIDRGNGVIRHIVLSTGGFLGVGNEQVAAPLSDFALVASDGNASNVRLSLPTYERALSNRPGFDRDRWLGLEEDQSWFQDLQGWASDLIDDEGDADQVAQQTFMNSGTNTVRGTIDVVQRVETENGDDRVWIGVRAENGETRKIMVGPAWYVLGRDASLNRGDQVTVVAFDRKHEENWHAKQISVGDTTTHYRDSMGDAKWTAEDVKRSGGDASSSDQPTRFFLASDLLGMKARASDTPRDESGGEIADAVVELTSGKLLMLSLDPDTNVLGIGATHKCVPMTVASIGSERDSIDARTDVLAKCEDMPDDAQVFIESVRFEPVYAAFGAQPVKLERKTSGDQSWHSDDHRRSSNGDMTQAVDRTDSKATRDNLAMLKAFRNGREVTLTGAAKLFGSMTFPGTDTKVKTVTVLTTDVVKRDSKADQNKPASNRTIVLGPVDWVDTHGTNITVGSAITVDGRAVTASGNDVVMANWVANGKGDQMVLWRDNRPTWHGSYGPVKR